MAKNEFVKICKMPQLILKSYAEKKLRETHDTVINKDGFLYAPGTFPVLLVAHMDTVHPKSPQKIVWSNGDRIVSSPEGIGGDDRCGVYMIFQILQKYDCSVVFCEDEEIGGIGAKNFLRFIAGSEVNWKYIVEFDRKGRNDAVFYDCDNPEFTEFVTAEFYRKEYGSFSDISVIAPAIGIAAVNLSCGYYKPHTTDEYVVFSEMEDSILAACALLERTSAKFEYMEFDSVGLSDGFGYGGYDIEQLYVVEFFTDEAQEAVDYHTCWAFSRREALGDFIIEHPDKCFNDVNDVYPDQSFT